jgi:hypothetical protein
LVLVWILVLNARLNSKEPNLETIANLLLTLDFNVFSKKNFKNMVPILVLVLGLVFHFLNFLILTLELVPKIKPNFDFVFMNWNLNL